MARRGRGTIAALMLAVATPAVAQPLGTSAFLMDERSGEILHADQPDALRHPASITKVMTLYLTFEALARGELRPADAVTMSRNAASQKPSRLGLGVGQSLPLDQAIRIVAVKSANDVAVAVAERIAGSETAFVARMNAKARALGMTRTHFANPTGLPDPDNVTTARDIATLAAALLRDFPAQYRYFGARTANYGAQVYANHNNLLGRVLGLDGIKTGYTADAGFTLVASAMRNGRRLIGVVLGAPSVPVRSRDMTQMLEDGFAALSARTGELRLSPPRLSYEINLEAPLLRAVDRVRRAR